MRGDQALRMREGEHLLKPVAQAGGLEPGPASWSEALERAEAGGLSRALGQLLLAQTQGAAPILRSGSSPVGGAGAGQVVP